MTVRLNAELMNKFAMGKIFRHNEEPINSIDFYHTGEWLVSASDDESIHLYDCKHGKETKVLNSKKYGIDLVRFTHDQDSIVCASKNTWDFTIRYMSLRSNTYIRYFKGHRSHVVGLTVSPKDDLVLSAGLDNVRLWDLRSPTCAGVLRRRGRCAVQFDPQGLVFGIATSDNALKMYDLRSFDKGPFGGSDKLYANPLEWSDMKFSPDGDRILLSSTSGVSLIVDAYNKHEVFHAFSGMISSEPVRRVEASFSSCGKFLACGHDTGDIFVYDSNSGDQVASLAGHAGPVGALRFNPRLAMLASACTNLAFWRPDLGEEGEENNE